MMSSHKNLAILKPCMICQAQERVAVFSYNQPDAYECVVGVGPEDYLRQWVRCGKCGFHYSVFSRDEDILDKIYTSSYRDQNSDWRKVSTEEIFQKVINLPEEESETKFRIKWIKKNIQDAKRNGLITMNQPPYRLLDIGGATGVFAYEFQDQEWKSCVIDPGESGKFIQQKYNIPYRQAYYQANSFPHAFDLISLVFVLEHLKDPQKILREIRKDMSKNSFLYLEVPDALCFQLKNSSDDIFNSCHLWMFTPNTLTMLLDQCGFEVFSLNRVKTKRGHIALMALSIIKRTN